MAGRPDYRTAVDIIAQTLAALLLELQGGSSGTRVDVGSDEDLLARWRSSVSVSSTLSGLPTTATNVTVTHSINLRAPVVIIVLVDAAVGITPSFVRSGDDINCQQVPVKANTRTAFVLRDEIVTDLIHWIYGNVKLTASASVTWNEATIMGLP